MFSLHFVAGLTVASPGEILCPAGAAACAKDSGCHAFGVYAGSFQLHGCAIPSALVPNNDWAVFVPTTADKSAWKPLGENMNVVESKCAVHPTTASSSSCGPTPPPPSPPPMPLAKFPYEALGSLDVGTGESSIFLFKKTLYVMDNIFCGYIDHAGNWLPAFKGHSYVRIRELSTGKLVANVTETISTDFVSAFVDHRPTGDVLWLSALDHDRCNHACAGPADLAARRAKNPGYTCGTGVLAISTTDLVHFHRTSVLPTTGTCNTEVTKVPVSPAGLPPHRYAMILEPFAFMLNNNADGNLSHGWFAAPSSCGRPGASAGGPSIRHEGGYYYVITGGTTVMLCRSKDLGHSDPWVCKVMVKPTGRGGAPGPGDGAVAPFAGFAKDAVRKDFPVMEKDVPAWDWNSNDADVCCTGGSSPSYLIWGASTQGGKSHLPPGSPSCTNAIGMANMTLEAMLGAFF